MAVRQQAGDEGADDGVRVFTTGERHGEGEWEGSPILPPGVIIIETQSISSISDTAHSPAVEEGLQFLAHCAFRFRLSSSRASRSLTDLTNMKGTCHCILTNAFHEAVGRIDPCRRELAKPVGGGKEKATRWVAFH